MFYEDQKERKARLFVEEFAGMFNGVFHPTKSAKEMKGESLDKDLKEAKI